MGGVSSREEKGPITTPLYKPSRGLWDDGNKPPLLPWQRRCQRPIIMLDLRLISLTTMSYSEAITLIHQNTLSGYKRLVFIIRRVKVA